MDINTPVNFRRCLFNRETQKVEDLDYEDDVRNDLYDIGIGVLAERDESWKETTYGVAFCLTKNNKNEQQAAHDNQQKMYARMDGWSPRTDIDGQKMLSGEEFRGQPGTVFVKDGNQMIKTTNIDNVPGQSGAPLMLIGEHTLDVAFEENVESRDKETQQRILIGDYQTLSICARVCVCVRVCFWWFYDCEHKTWRIHCNTIHSNFFSLQKHCSQIDS